ncbi:hypothetical protein [Paracoccus sp. MC1862]|uniref:hypothetical protein n=1 Tax=Paracoccus sp. MC1862 TaxID=2760307 RepID=UPI001600AAB9|nr:hypothetical protein [Paracoccus sp. MC1862]MBB1496827.1 hypothetical protein [Paracoccus sp. MC1862]QQO46539.1 hypothetical protein JGR78_03630 [Paracoccus sp. MC1862]
MGALYDQRPHAGGNLSGREAVITASIIHDFDGVDNQRGFNNGQGRKKSPKAASAASRVLKDGRTGKDSKTAAGSALSQAPDKKKQISR